MLHYSWGNLQTRSGTIQDINKNGTVCQVHKNVAAERKRRNSLIAVVCKYCFEEIHLPVYKRFQRILTPSGTIKHYCLLFVCHTFPWGKVCKGSERMHYALCGTNQLSQWGNKWLTSASRVERKETNQKGSAVGGLWALNIFQQLSWVIPMSRKVWSHQLRGSSIQWQNPLSIHIKCPKVNLPTIQLFSLHSTAHQKLKSCRANTQSTKPVICKQKKKEEKKKQTSTSTSTKSYHKTAKLKLKIMQNRKCNQSHFSVFLYNFVAKQTVASQQRWRFKQIIKPPSEHEISCYTQSDTKTTSASFNNNPWVHSIYLTCCVRLSNQVSDLSAIKAV